MRGAAPTCEPPCHASILVLLPPIAPTHTASGRYVLRVAPGRSEAPIASLPERRSILVSPNRPALPSAGRPTWQRDHLVLDRLHAEYDQLVGR
jgi:hypothetical protein